MASELGDPIEDVEGLVSERSDGVTGVADVGVFVGLEDADHVVEVEHDHEGGHCEEEPTHTHPGVDEDGGGFVLLVHVLLVVDVVGRHLQDECIVSTATAQHVEAFTLVGPQGLGGEAVEVPVVSVL